MTRHRAPACGRTGSFAFIVSRPPELTTTSPNITVLGSDISLDKAQADALPKMKEAWLKWAQIHPQVVDWAMRLEQRIGLLGRTAAIRRHSRALRADLRRYRVMSSLAMRRGQIQKSLGVLPPEGPDLVRLRRALWRLRLQRHRLRRRADLHRAGAGKTVSCSGPPPT